jgi:hypothetical protein
MVPGVYGTVPIISAWMANNSEPYYRRATSIALGFIAANLVCLSFLKYINIFIHLTLFQGGILSTWSFPTNEGPKFRKTTVMNLIL